MTMLHLVQGCKAGPIPKISQCSLHHIYRLKKKNHNHINYADKTFHKIQYIHVKNSENQEERGVSST